MDGSHNCSNSAGNAAKRCECGEETCENSRLWADFENCAQAVTRLYSDVNWKSLQCAAAGATQLYKSACDSHRKGFERGFQAGRSSLAKEILAAFSPGTKIDHLLEVLVRNIRIGVDENSITFHPEVISSETVSAVQMFQQALAQQAAHNSSPQRDRNMGLDKFLATQVQRHRKRARSPSSPSAHLKRQKKF